MNVKKTKSSKKIILKITMSMTDGDVCDLLSNVRHDAKAWKGDGLQRRRWTG